MARTKTTSQSNYTDKMFMKDLTDLVDMIDVYNKNINGPSGTRGGARGGAKVDNKKRSYKLNALNNRELSNESGTYHGAPAQAAKRAFRQIVKARKLKVGTKMKVSIRETTQGGKFQDKVFTYNAQLKKGNGKTITIGGKSFKVKHEYVVKKA